MSLESFLESLAKFAEGAVSKTERKKEEMLREIERKAQKASKQQLLAAIEKASNSEVKKVLQDVYRRRFG